jgi:hypothetical protein
LTIVLSVLLRFTESDYHFGIFNLFFMCHTNETKRLNEITVYYMWKFALLSCEQWCNRTSDDFYDQQKNKKKNN